MAENKLGGCSGSRDRFQEVIVPFRFDLREILARFKSIATLDGVAINLPGATFNVKIDDVERRVAREIVIRLSDRRVLNSRECCGSCVSNALESVQKIRQVLVDSQVQLSRHVDRPLFLLIRVAAEGIRQFLTFHEQLERQARRIEGAPVDEYAPFPNAGFFYRQEYLPALENLRAHMYRTLQQIARIGDIEIPNIGKYMRYDEVWPSELYERAA